MDSWRSIQHRSVRNGNFFLTGVLIRGIAYRMFSVQLDDRSLNRSKLGKGQVGRSSFITTTQRRFLFRIQNQLIRWWAAQVKYWWMAKPSRSIPKRRSILVAVPMEHHAHSQSSYGSRFLFQHSVRSRGLSLYGPGGRNPSPVDWQ